MTPLVVSLDHATKVYRLGEVEVAALREADLNIHQGEFVVVLGPSGCGKTTLMNLIGGLDSPTSGRVLIEGQDISEFDEEQLTRYRRVHVGFIFQFFNLVTTLTALENVQLAAEISDDSLDPMETLASVGLGDRAHHFPSELSGGEQQRVAIARALVKRAPLMLCDEPTGELDFETGRMILALLHQTTHDRGQTVLVVTHNASVGAIADRVLRMRSGRIVSDEVNAQPMDPMELSW